MHCHRTMTGCSRRVRRASEGKLFLNAFVDARLPFQEVCRAGLSGLCRERRVMSIYLFGDREFSETKVASFVGVVLGLIHRNGCHQLQSLIAVRNVFFLW